MDFKITPFQAVLAVFLILVGLTIFSGQNQQGNAVNTTSQGSDVYSVDATALPELKPTETAVLADKESFNLSADIVKRKIEGKDVAWFGYNMQSPGPLLKVKQGSTVFINFTNNLDQPTTVHWHGLRLENAYDGVPEVTQEEVLPGGSFEYKLYFPDAGLFWYHPHVREDLQQELGLYGAILVEPTESDGTEQQEVLVLDDVLVDDGGIPEFENDRTNFALMGRYGNLLLVNGVPNYKISASQGKILRLYLLNVANVRPINFAIEGAKLKVVGGDASLYEKPFLADSVVLGPSERAIVELFFDNPGDYKILNKTPVSALTFGSVSVQPSQLNLQAQEEFGNFSETATADEVAALRQYFDGAPDFEYELLIRWPPMDRMMERMGHSMTEMHVGSDGIEWEDSMRHINEITTNEELTWLIRDAKTKKENMGFLQTIKKGEYKKIRITNLENS